MTAPWPNWCFPHNPNPKRHFAPASCQRCLTQHNTWSRSHSQIPLQGPVPCQQQLGQPVWNSCSQIDFFSTQLYYLAPVPFTMDASQTANAAGHPPPVAAAADQGTLPIAPAAVEQQEPPTAGKKRSKLRSWDEMYQCLLRYKEENNGSVAVPRQYPPDKNLGEWVIKVRMFQRKLSPEQRKKLDKIGFSFESRLEGYERKWNEMFEELNKFKNENGHCM